MLAVGNSLVSEDVIEKKFICDLIACKGACCVEGESGAPLEKDEIGILEDVYPKVKPFIPASGIKAIEKQGKYIVDTDGDYVTPLVAGKHCAYTYFENGFAKCAIEKAFYEKKISYKKPISCHLYPIRVEKTKTYYTLNYHKWEICKAACKLGEKEKVPVYSFLKEPLIRKFGKQWFEELNEMALAFNNGK
jgi:Protein of unknown function (DUF3109)